MLYFFILFSFLLISLLETTNAFPEISGLFLLTNMLVFNTESRQINSISILDTIIPKIISTKVQYIPFLKKH